MRENAVRNVTYIVVMCAEIRYNPLNVGNCAQKCGKFPRKGRALCGKMREHPHSLSRMCGKMRGFPGPRNELCAKVRKELLFRQDRRFRDRAVILELCGRVREQLHGELCAKVR